MLKTQVDDQKTMLQEDDDAIEALRKQVRLRVVIRAFVSYCAAA